MLHMKYAYKHNVNNKMHANHPMQFEEVIYFLSGIVGDVEQRHRHIAGDMVYQVLFPEV